MKEQRTHRAKVGDVIAVHGHHVGESERLCEILEILGEPDRVHFRVRWDDDHESIYFPGTDARILVRGARDAKTD